LWFFILIMCRLVLFAFGMALLALREGKANPLATFLGKASIFALMVLYVMEIAGLFGVPWIGNALVVRIVEYAVTLVVVVSMVDKAIFLTRMFQKAPPRQTQAPRSGG
jgi:phosphatidylglycerophosphate synthase